MESEMLMDEVVLLLKQGCSVTLRVTGKSMCPFLMPTRDKVLLCPALSFQIGDIILVGTASTNCLHTHTMLNETPALTIPTTLFVTISKRWHLV